LTFQDKHNTRTLSVKIKFIQTYRETAFLLVSEAYTNKFYIF
jgi:hypothetical protein